MSEQENGVPTDEALEQAQAKAEEQTQESEETPKQTKEEFDIQKEINNLKADMGRGGKALTEVQKMRDEIASLKSLLESQVQERQTQEAQDNIVTTESDVLNVVQKYQQKQYQEQQKYNDNYIGHIARLTLDEGLDDDQASAVEKILSESIKGSRTNFRDPQLDAEINFQKAMRILDKNGGKKVNLKGDDPKGTGIGAPSENQTKVNAIPKLDKATQELADQLIAEGKMTPEQVATALKGM